MPPPMSWSVGYPTHVKLISMLEAKLQIKYVSDKCIFTAVNEVAGR